MTWRNWSFVVVLFLLNYIVFSILGSYVFLPSTDITPTATAQPTFTPGARVLTRVAPIQYPFLTPGASTSAPRTATAAASPTPSATRAP